MLNRRWNRGGRSHPDLLHVGLSRSDQPGYQPIVVIEIDAEMGLGLSQGNGRHGYSSTGAAGSNAFQANAWLWRMAMSASRKA